MPEDLDLELTNSAYCQDLPLEFNALKALHDKGSKFPGWFSDGQGGFVLPDWIDAGEALEEMRRTQGMVDELDASLFSDPSRAELFASEFLEVKAAVEEASSLGVRIWFSAADDMDPPEDPSDKTTWKQMAKDKTLQPSATTFRRFVEALYREGERGGQDWSPVVQVGVGFLANETVFPDVPLLAELSSFLPHYEFADIHDYWISNRKAAGQENIEYRLPPKLLAVVKEKIGSELDADGEMFKCPVDYQKLFELYFKPVAHGKGNNEEIERLDSFWTAVGENLSDLHSDLLELLFRLVDSSGNWISNDHDHIGNCLAVFESSWFKGEALYSDGLLTRMMKLVLSKCPQETAFDQLEPVFSKQHETIRQTLAKAMAFWGSTKALGKGEKGLSIDQRWFEFVDANLGAPWDGRPICQKTEWLIL